MTAQHSRRRPVGAVAGLVVTVLALAVLVGVVAWRPHHGAPASAPTTPVVAGRTSQPTLAPVVAQAHLPKRPAGASGPAHGTPAPSTRVEPPERIRIPAIGVDSSLESLGVLGDGTIAPPRKWGEAGWYAGGTVPGQVGPAVIAGHIDSTSGPAVFFRLHQLRPGDIVVVTDRAGIDRRFRVTEQHQYPKRAFPASIVYGPTPFPELRLITCSGDFDRAARSYVDNLVVFARLI